MSQVAASFKTLDIGSAPSTTVPLEIVEVELGASSLLDDYVVAFVREARRVNPILAEQVQLDEQEVMEYANYLLTQRVRIVQNNCPDYRRLKSMYIPSYLQYVLSLIGEVIDRSYGLKMVPVLREPSTATFEEMLIVSEKIGCFERFLQILQDAMPRSVEGDAEVMSTALIGGHVRSYKHGITPSSTYVTAVLDMKLRKEAMLSVLYRVQYDDVQFIIAALLTNKRLFT